MKRALYLHGFLGGCDDMRPLFQKDVQCESVDLLKHLDAPDKILRRHEGPYDYAVAYSFGGRVLAKLLNIDSSYVKRPLFCSTRITAYSHKELQEREKFKEKLLEKLDVSVEEFHFFWKSLSLFSGHSMKDYRRRHKLKEPCWSKAEIQFYLKTHFTYSAPELSAFEARSFYLYGQNDEKYKRERQKLSKMHCYAFSNSGHRFLFENPDGFNSFIQKKVLD